MTETQVVLYRGDTGSGRQVRHLFPAMPREEISACGLVSRSEVEWRPISESDSPLFCVVCLSEAERNNGTIYGRPIQEWCGGRGTV